MILANDVPQVPKNLGPFAQLLLPALVTLIPALLTAAFKTFQDHSRIRRSSDLTDRICKLSKDISELPELPAVAVELPVHPRQALVAELNAAICEITSLHSKPAHRVTAVSTSAWTKVRTALLLYRPKGALALMLHTTFYLYSLVMIVFLISLLSDKTQPLISIHPASEFMIDLFLLVVFTGLFSIPAVILRNYAVRVRRRQTPDPQPIANPIAEPAPMPVPATGHGD